MIIKGIRVASARSATPLLRHLLNGEENDRVSLVQNTVEDARAALGDARAAGKKFWLRHFIINPAAATNRDQAIMVVGLLAKDFGFDPTTAIIFEHEKPRAVDEAFGTHWHCLVPEVDAATGRVLDSRFNYLRHEKVARLAEHRLGHPLVRGLHERAVIAALESDGELEAAARLRWVVEREPEAGHQEAFSSDVHQMGKRKGVDIPAARALIRAAWETTTTWNEFVDALTQAGFRVIAGSRDATPIVQTSAGSFVGAVHRLARVRRIDLQRRKLIHERAEEPTQAPAGQPSQRARDAGIAARRCTDNPTSAVDPDGERSARIIESRPGHRVADTHPESDAGLSIKSGSRASEAGHGGPVHPGGRATYLRAALARNASAARQLLEQARKLAQPPQDRVRSALEAHEQRVKDRLQDLAKLPTTFPELDDAHRAAKRALAMRRELEAPIVAAKKKHDNQVKRQPQGLMAGIRGETRAWAEQLKRIEARIAELERQDLAAWEDYVKWRERIAELKKELIRRRSKLAKAPGRQKLRAAAERELARISFAKILLEKNPVLALGGLAMLLAAAAVTALLNGDFVSRFGKEPFRG